MKLQIVGLVGFLLHVLHIQCSAQVVSAGIGQMFYNSKTIVQVVHQYESNNNKPYYSLDFTFPEFGRYLYGLELSTYQGWVDFNAPGETWSGFGSSRTTLFRLSPYLGYNMQPRRKFMCIPYLKGIIEQSFITGLTSGISRVTEIDEALGYKGTIFVQPIQRIQLAPGAGMILSWNPVGRIYLRGNIQYTYGYRPFQKYYFEYSYNGVEQPTAEWHANGTGVFASVSVGIKLWKNK